MSTIAGTGGWGTDAATADKRLAGRVRTPSTPSTRRAIGLCASRPGRSAEDTLAGAGALEARRGEETHGAWNGARDVEFGSARTVQEADV